MLPTRYLKTLGAIALVLGVSSLAATSRADSFPPDAQGRDPWNRCLLSRVLVTANGESSELAQLEALVDGTAATAIALAADKAAVEFHFLGAPRWLNRVEIVTDAPAFDIQVLTLDKVWTSFSSSSGAGLSAPATTLRGADVFVRGLRFVPASGEAGAGDDVHLAEITATFEVKDPDGPRVGPAADGLNIHANWCNEYPGAGNDLSQTDDDVEDFIDDMPGDWTNYAHGNDNSHEEHFKRSDLGGVNGSHVDDSDISYYAGHGATEDDTDGDVSRSLRFGDEDYDDNDLTPGEANGAWGNGDMEWMCLHACKTMQDDDNRDRWFRCMSGLHLTLGFKTNALDTDLGDDFADYLVDNGAFDSAEKVKTSWFDGAEATHGDGYTAAVLGETSDMGNDYVWGEGTTKDDPTHNCCYIYWSYSTCGFPCLRPFESSETVGSSLERATPAPPADPVVIQTESERGIPVVVDRSLLVASPMVTMPIYNVLPANVDTPYVRSIANAICGVGGPFCGGQIGPGNPGFLNLIDGQYELRVCQNTGSMHYHDSDNWLAWRTQPPQLPSTSAAISQSENLLNQIGRRRPDAVIDRVDYVGQGARFVPLTGVGNDVPESTFATARRVVYKRRLNNFKVAGPGGSMTVALGGGGIVERIFEGAWRQAIPGPQVNIIPVQSAMSFLAANGSDGTVDGLGTWAEQIQIDSWELGYYEYSCHVAQTTIRPVYIFHCTVTETPSGQMPPSTSQSDIHVWAEALPPDAIIQSPPDGTCVPSGSQVCFNGTGNGGIPPLMYSWSDDMSGPLGTGPLVCATLELPPPGHGQEDSSHTVTLTVTDALGREAHAAVRICLTANPSAVGDPAGPERLAIQALLPNPTLGSVRVQFQAPRPATFHLEIYDLAGRRVSSGEPQDFDAGAHTLTWDGRTDSGQLATAGMYFIHLVGNGEGAVRKVVMH